MRLNCINEIFLLSTVRITLNLLKNNMSYRVQTLSETDPMDDFLKVPQVVYQFNPYWVAPIQKEVCRTLNRQMNPYFINASLRKFVCYKNGHPVARAIAVINHDHWKKYGQRSAFFGYFESTHDPEAADHFHNMAMPLS